MFMMKRTHIHPEEGSTVISMHMQTQFIRERDREREREREYEPPENKEFMKRVLTEFCMVNYIRANE